MLVISRMQNESIVISLQGIPADSQGEVTITIVDVRPSSQGEYKVRLGIEAPSTTVIHRSEVWKVIKKSQRDEERVQWEDE